jgi:hypothetical protein
MDNIDSLTVLSEAELSRLKTFGGIPMLKLYTKLYDTLIQDKELTDHEIAVLERIRNIFGLAKEDVGYDAQVLPYLFVNHLRKTDQLPTQITELDVPLLLKKGEFAHYAAATLLKEPRIMNLGYRGGSHGVSFRVMKGVYYRVGAHRGRMIKEEQLVQTSAGVLVITNKRLFLVPATGNKPITIPLDKIHFYRCSENALEVYKEGREKGFFFILTAGAVEIFGICLGALLQHDR